MAKDKNIEAERKAKYKAHTRTRKKVRKDKRRDNKKYNHSNATWRDDDGKMMQNCGMGGTCEFPCNGDC